MTDHEPTLETLPPKLVARLRERERAVAIIDGVTDRAILAAAARHFAQRRPGARIGRRLLPFAAAASLLVAVMLVQPFGGGRNLADDFDGSGRVDILDAFALARTELATNVPRAAARADALAERIVALRGTP